MGPAEIHTYGCKLMVTLPRYVWICLSLYIVKRWAWWTRQLSCLPTSRTLPTNNMAYSSFLRPLSLKFQLYSQILSFHLKSFVLLCRQLTLLRSNWPCVLPKVKGCFDLLLTRKRDIPEHIFFRIQILYLLCLLHHHSAFLVTTMFRSASSPIVCSCIFPANSVPTLSSW